MKGGLTNHSPSENHSNHSSDISPTLHHYPILEFVTSYPEIIHLEETFVGKAAKQERTMGTTKHRGLGEAAIAEFLANLDDKIARTDPVLVLFEDSDIRRINAFVQGNVHLLSTRALLIGMEECGIIASAEEVWQAILNAGRVPSAKFIDQPSQTVNSYWKQRERKVTIK